MAAAMVGGAFLSASLQVLFDRMASRPVMDFIWRRKLNDASLKKLKITLLAVNAVLNDAEEKQMTNPVVKEWLDELKDAIYAAEDILDEIATEASRCKLEAEFHTSTDQVCKFISTSLNPFDDGIKSKIDEILDNLEYIAKQKDVLGLKEVTRRKLSQKLPTSPLVEESGIYGRDDDREEIIKSLLSDDASGNEICVITIVGMGGVGKTTLAQLVYNDDRVKERFDLKAWVCVSEEFDVSRVTRTILEVVTSSACDIKDFGLLQVKLKEALTEKKFLLILDDVWNEKYNDWDVLRSPFRSAAKGSKIIVTTRNENVASIMRTTPIHHLKQLLDEDCWSLFVKHAFYNGNSTAHPKLEAIAREIVKKCKGLPLAAKILGGLLRSKQDVKEWNKILKSDIWDFSNDESDILPTLRLSYHYLPSHLKRCFAYCSIFPKDYVFRKQQLVLLWMAEDFLQHPNRKRRLEEVGDEYFHDLILRSFFQRSGGGESCFVMHDLVSDLAQFVSEKFCFRLEGDTSHEIPKKTRHLSYCTTWFDASKRFEALYDAKCLRTFLLLSPMSRYIANELSHDLLPRLRSLRVLSLSRNRNIIELPESIANLKHLRYLDLSSTAIRRLPDSTSTLHNLQTLMLSCCYSLTELPMNMQRLINLRHLDVSWTTLKEMPMHMSRLRSLQTLSTFIVGKHNRSTISELRELRHLRGALHILELQNVAHARDALEANLKDKEFLDKLVLEWGTDIEDSQNGRDVLDKLQPHANLKRLTIKCYGGTRFPDWLGDQSFSSMVYLRLSNCKYCFSLPPLGQLPCLKDLYIVGFDRVERVGLEFYGNVSFAVKPFGSLEILRFENMLELVEWFCSGEQGGEFPHLRELYIKKCPKLTRGLPGHLPSLTKLVISECQQFAASLPRAPALRNLELNYDKVALRSNDFRMSAVCGFTSKCSTSHPSSHVSEISNVTHQRDDQMTTLPSSIEILEVSGISQLKELPPCLHQLTIKSCNALESLPEGMIHINTCLHYLEIGDCPSLKSFPKGGLPTTLKTLFIWGCRELELLPPEETMHNYYASLESLSIDCSCDSLKSFPLVFFPELNYLQISDCRNLESIWIPEGLHEDLTSLNKLDISYCPKLVSFPKGGLPTPSLTFLSVMICENLKSLPERMHTVLPSLQCLKIGECPELESFPEGGLPSNLISLSVSNCDKLMARRMEWGLQTLVSLTNFAIRRCEEVESFPEEWLLPSNLTFLEIYSLPNLKYLDKRGLQHLTSLQQLNIGCCPKLQCFPEEGLPNSLSLLDIRECPLLEQQCQREKVEEWPKIDHIPHIVINEEVIS